jgi:molybdopterin biosynthesis enzyme
MFDLEDAQRRLVAVQEARRLVAEAVDLLAGADVKNVKVARAVILCRKELADYEHTTNYAIRKREARANYQPACQAGSREVEEQDQSSCAPG